MTHATTRSRVRTGSRLTLAATLFAGVALAAPAAAQTEPGPDGATCQLIVVPAAPTVIVPNAYDFVLVNLEGGGQFRVDDPGANAEIVSPTGENIVSLLKCIEPEVPPTPEPTVEPTPEPTAEPTPEPTPEPTVLPPVEPTPEPTPEPSPEPTILPPATPTVPPGGGGGGGGGGGQLPATGSESGPLVATGLGLVAIGTGIALTSRRLRSTPTHARND